MLVKLFESALGIADPWFYALLERDDGAKTPAVLPNARITFDKPQALGAPVRL